LARHRGAASGALALDGNDNEARRLLAAWARGLGFVPSLDPIGNLFIRRPGSAADADPVLAGSHTDTQPSGGKFDGIYGVLAACEALEAIERAGIQTRRALEAVVWTCEEGGARFPMGTMGSSAFIGLKPLPEILAQRDDAGISVGEALAATRQALPDIGGAPARLPGRRLRRGAYRAGSGARGARRHDRNRHRHPGGAALRRRSPGQDAHAGTTSRARRKDALSAAVAMVGALERLFHDDPTDTVRFTIGRFRIQAGCARRGPRPCPLHDRFPPPRQCRAGAARRPGRGHLPRPCRALLRERHRDVMEPPRALHQRGPRHHRECGGGARTTGACAFSPVPVTTPCISPRSARPGMIFVPCEKGISHNETENATPADLAAGTRVLAATLVELANG